MKEKKQKILLIAGLVLVSALLVFGISRVLYKESAAEILESTASKDAEIVVEETDIEEVLEETITEPEEIEESELVIEIEKEVVDDGKEQQLQETPEKTEYEKPEEPPRAEEEPEETPKEEPAKPVEDKVHGKEQGGQIYIDGFGWVTNHGGGGSGTTANDMYENGNKVGIME